jgi:hypothetical protein
MGAGTHIAVEAATSCSCAAAPAMWRASSHSRAPATGRSCRTSGGRPATTSSPFRSRPASSRRGDRALAGDRRSAHVAEHDHCRGERAVTPSVCGGISGMRRTPWRGRIRKGANQLRLSALEKPCLSAPCWRSSCSRTSSYPRACVGRSNTRARTGRPRLRDRSREPQIRHGPRNSLPVSDVLEGTARHLT